MNLSHSSDTQEVVARENSAEFFKPQVVTVVGPLFILTSLLLLLIKESPFHIDFLATAMFGLFLSWQYRLKGFAMASTLLLSVGFYDYFFVHDPIGWWEIGLAITVEGAFFITSLSSLESIDWVSQSKEKEQSRIDYLEKYVAEIETLKGKLEKRVKENEEALKVFQGQAITHQNVDERREKVLKLAHEELLNEIQRRESIEREHFDEKRQFSLLEEALEKAQLQVLQIPIFKELVDKKEHELKMLKAHQMEQIRDTQSFEDLKREVELSTEILHKKEQALNELETVCLEHQNKYALLFNELKRKTEDKEDSERKLQDLADQLEKLTGRLKDLEQEKDDLEKQAQVAIQAKTIVTPEEGLFSPELRQARGLYYQLREQFEEKQQILDQTRHEFFLLNEKTLIKEKIEKEQNEDLINEISLSYEKLIEEFHSYSEGLEAQLTLYEELISKANRV